MLLNLIEEFYYEIKFLYFLIYIFYNCFKINRDKMK